MKLKFTRSDNWNAIVYIETDTWEKYYWQQILIRLFNNPEIQNEYNELFFYCRLLIYMTTEAYYKKYSDEKIRKLYKLIMEQKPTIHKKWKWRFKKIYNKILANVN